MMWPIKKQKTLIILLLVLTGTVTVVMAAVTSTVPAGKPGAPWRIYVTGLGTVEGSWSGDTGVAVLRVSTQTSPVQGEEEKVIDLLVANRGSETMKFSPDIFLVSRRGVRCGLKGAGQPEVMIAPGAMSQGTVIIRVPKGIPDSEWKLEIKGGNLQGKIDLPLRVQKVAGGQE